MTINELSIKYFTTGTSLSDPSTFDPQYNSNPDTYTCRLLKYYMKIDNNKPKKKKKTIKHLNETLR